MQIKFETDPEPKITLPAKNYQTFCSAVLRQPLEHLMFMLASQNNARLPFEVVLGYLGGKLPVVDNVLLSHKQEIKPTTSLGGNCT